MKKIFVESTLTVWGAKYVTFPELRQSHEQNMIVVQMEPGVNGSSYMVEIMDKDKYLELMNLKGERNE